MNSITLYGLSMRSGELFNATRELTKRADGTWHTTNFGDALQEARGASKSGASQSCDCDTYETEPTTRKKLTDRELAELASKYDPRNMTQDQYDTFLNELVEKGVLSRSDTLHLGYKGFVFLDNDPEVFGPGKAGGGCVIGVENSDDDPIRSLQDADGDLIRWLESMMARQDQWTGPSSREKAKALDTLYDIVKRM